MGWDLYSRGEKHYFRVGAFVWPKLALALQSLGADIEKMATDNSGKYVPAATAREWASAIERGVDDLRVATVRDKDANEGEGWFLVPSSYKEREIRRMLRDFYGEPEKVICESQEDDGSYRTLEVKLKGYRSYPLRRVGPVPKDIREFLLRFADFCRRSGGFYQY